MKKLLFIFPVFIFAANIQAQEAPEFRTVDVLEDMPIQALFIPYSEYEETGPWRMRNRTFEIGLVNLNFGFANNFLTAGDIFRDTLLIDFGNIDRGFNLTFDVNVRPFFFNININDNWGFGLDVGNITAFGNIQIPGNLLRLNKARNEPFGAGAAVFADVGIPVFFHIRNVWQNRALRINVRPAAFASLVYSVPSMSYTFRDHVNEDGIRGSLLEIDIAMRVHTPFSLNPDDNIMSTLDIGSATGVDFSVGAELPIFSWLDVGVNFVNIPISPARLSHVMEINDRLTLDTSMLDLESIINGDIDSDFFSLPEDLEPVYFMRNHRTFRPFKMVFYANYRPFNTPLLTVIPMLGLSVNTVFAQSVAPEAGIKVRNDLANILVTTIGIKYENQMWKNGIDFILNLRAFGLTFGISMQSQSFVRSWQAAGVRANIGLQFGW